MTVEESKSGTPRDPEAILADFASMASERGPDAWVEIFDDVGLWKIAPPLVQNVCAQVLKHRLGDDWIFHGIRRYSCMSKKTVTEFEGFGRHQHTSSVNGEIEFPIAVFEYEPLEMEFSLIPGEIRSNKDHGHGADCPCDQKSFLLARWPAVWSAGDAAARRVRGGVPITGDGYEEVIRQLAKSGLRLPTSKEWRHACRGGATTNFFWGDEFDDAYVWHRENSSLCWTCQGLGTRPDGGDCSACQGCGRRGPCAPVAPLEHEEDGRWNAYGLVDMIGNVWEWCLEGDAKGVCCGGSVQDEASALSRGKLSKWVVGFARKDLESFGFRAALSIPRRA